MVQGPAIQPCCSTIRTGDDGPVGVYRRSGIAVANHGDRSVVNNPERLQYAPFPARTEPADRVISVYVFDLLTQHETTQLLDAARAVLRPEGLVGLVSLTHGTRGLPRLVSNTWTRVWKRAPMLVGGCRPIALTDRLEAAEFRIVDHRVVTSWGITSEVATARPS